MASVNKIIVLGNLGKDPEIRHFADGKQVTNVTIATSHAWKDKSTGDKKEETEWHRVSFFGRLAEIAGEYLQKGSSVYVEGRIKTRKYEKDGIERYSTEIIAESMQLINSKNEQKQTDRKESKSVGDLDDDIPF